MNQEIIVNIYKDKSYLNLCKSIAKKPLLAEELHAEFITSLLEIKDNRLIEAKEGGYLAVFCVGIINNIWGKRNRYKIHVDGSTSPLFEYTSTVDVSGNQFVSYSEPYNLNIEYVSTQAANLINEEMNSNDAETKYKASVFYYSNFKYDSARQFSKVSRIHYDTVIKTCRKYRQYLRDKFKNKIND